MSDFFDDFNKIFKKDLFPAFVKYLKDPDNKIADNLNDLLNDPHSLLSDVFEKFSKNKDNGINQRTYNDIENVTDINPEADNEYDELFTRLIVIEENMMKVEKILKDKN